MERPLDSKSDSVFETLLHGIVAGEYRQGAHLPAERELARTLGASRSTLRDAIRRLTEWGLVEPRRGAGVLVRDQHEWSIEVLPAYLRHGNAQPETIGTLVRDLLAMRRGLFSSLLPPVAERLSGLPLPRTRSLAEDAWASRGEPGNFAAADFEMIRSVFEAAHMLPAVWILNRVAGVYVDIARSVSGAMSPPEDYVESHHSWIGALESGDPATAVGRLEHYFLRHDSRLLSLWGLDP
jgi:GntR family transcriptional regulator, transcriptional repressor for pyruvate dehydrogenase complex